MVADKTWFSKLAAGLQWNDSQVRDLLGEKDVSAFLQTIGGLSFSELQERYMKALKPVQILCLRNLGNPFVFMGSYWC